MSSELDSIAFLFLTLGEVKNPLAWEAWFHKARKEVFDIHVHAKFEDEVKHPLFKNNLIQGIKTKWGTVSLVQAHLLLLNKALKKERNRWFILLSDSCLPLVSFEVLLKTLRKGHHHSCFDLHSVKAQKEQRKNIQLITSDLLVHDDLSPVPCRLEVANGDGMQDEELIKDLLLHEEITAHSQWCILNRKDAEILVQGGNIETWFEAYRRFLRPNLVKRSYLLAPDELFILTFLRHFHRTQGTSYKFINRKSTFAHCCLDIAHCCCSLGRAAHPLSFTSLQKDLLSLAFAHDSLFARKFEAEQGIHIEHFEALWESRWESNRILDVAEISSALANPDRLTQRQQLVIAMKLSRHAGNCSEVEVQEECDMVPSPAVEEGRRSSGAGEEQGKRKRSRVCRETCQAEPLDAGEITQRVSREERKMMATWNMIMQAEELRVKKEARIRKKMETSVEQSKVKEQEGTGTTDKEVQKGDSKETIEEEERTNLGASAVTPKKAEGGRKNKVLCYNSQDVGKVIKILCEDDGLLPVELLEYKKEKKFLVKFLSDGTCMLVDLARVVHRQLKVRHAVAGGGGGGGGEKVEEPKSREERKLLATLNSMLKAEKMRIRREQTRVGKKSTGSEENVEEKREVGREEAGREEEEQGSQGEEEKSSNTCLKGGGEQGSPPEQSLYVLEAEGRREVV
ncbi:hypothetical protein GUITHDRAFT_134409 [Guillardia theta CCMP2712]|uniref:Uncharacterized protein n=1 Tax=Guillardia theta (strain CCMP2712) TaxID=905079 RepID=L1JT50_GUITC|nr:hypothetical protein GUITHDRAFT_134409 [Guillardia theta CCMP2712]EKX51484.1 hypothetical protein GUITHDRAFT_134409 [Guillardia theta CCMP2712]|eukprot:XP_005838464.1 hypothetical protein GUITHDRAFT_134409 [Guillardia theta CCMP2712]